MEIWEDSSPGIFISGSDAPEEIKKMLKFSPELFLVAESGGEVVGTVIGGFDGRRGMIYHLAVARSHRGNATGRALMEAVQAKLIALGCRKAYLMVTPENRSIILYYEQDGWKEMQVTVMGKELHS